MIARALEKLRIAALLVAFNVIIAAGVLYTLEAYYRHTDPREDLPFDGWIQETRELYTWGHLVINNSLAFRERKFSMPKEKAIFRIMVLGDSLTWGAGLAPEERYTDLLDRLLRERFPERPIEVLNFALPGAPTIDERDVLRKYLDIVEPDLIVVGFCENDPEPSKQMAAARYQAEIEKFEVIEGLPRWLSSWRLPYFAERVRNAFVRTHEMLGLLPPWYVVLQRSYDQDAQDWKDFVQALKDIKRMSDGIGLADPIFIVLNHGPRRDRPNDYSNPDEVLRLYLAWYRQAEKAASEVGFRTVNVVEDLATEYANQSMAVNVLDGHPNAGVNRIYARNLLQDGHGKP